MSDLNILEIRSILEKVTQSFVMKIRDYSYLPFHFDLHKWSLCQIREVRMSDITKTRPRYNCDKLLDCRAN
jgi:hypothetical protein